ncbi:MAG TPA: HAD family hydrolase [Candidatus Binataceae bacterium]|nr:HAD family hydrolase [Candidatus Binataceae bacterium]
MADREFKAVVIDLYDTLVDWEPASLPVLQWRGREVRSTAPLLFPVLEAELGERFDRTAFMEAHDAVYLEIFNERAADTPAETTCHERMLRTLKRTGLEHGHAHALADRLRGIHMGRIREVTKAPARRVEAMKKIAGRYRVGLISNFDDGETGHQIVRDTGIHSLFEDVIISADTGLRKPHPLIFQRILDSMRLKPTDVLYVGDTPRDDVLGSKRAGMYSAWIRRKDRELPEGIPAPDFIIGDLAELPEKIGL